MDEFGGKSDLGPSDGVMPQPVEVALSILRPWHYRKHETKNWRTTGGMVVVTETFSKT